MLAGMTDKRKAIRFCALALLVLFGGCLIALFSPRLQVAIVVASFVGYVACTRRALALCRTDELVFESKSSRTREDAAREALRAGLVGGSAGALSLGRSVNAASRFAASGPQQRRPPTFRRHLEGTR
jgi:hypothetical protein